MLGGGVSTHVALFTCTIFHTNLFQVEYCMSVGYKRADINILPLENLILKYLLCD